MKRQRMGDICIMRQDEVGCHGSVVVLVERGEEVIETAVRE